jgi:hypothetical protein
VKKPYTEKVCLWHKTNLPNQKSTYNTACGYSLSMDKVQSICPRCGQTTALSPLIRGSKQTHSIQIIQPIQKVKPVRNKLKKHDLSQIIHFPNEERVLQTTNNLNEDMSECVTRVQAIEAASYWGKQWDDQHEKNARVKESIIKNSAKLLTDLILSDLRNPMLPSEISTILNRVCATVRIDVEIAQHKLKR